MKFILIYIIIILFLIKIINDSSINQKSIIFLQNFKNIKYSKKNLYSKNTEFLTYSRKYSPDKTGKSTSKYNRFTFPGGGSISVICYDMDKDFIDPNDQLYVAISSKKFIDIISQFDN